MNRHGRIALLQVFLLILSIIAIGYVLGSEARLVSGEGLYRLINDPGSSHYGEYILEGTPIPEGVDSALVTDAQFDAGFVHQRAVAAAAEQTTAEVGLGATTTPTNAHGIVGEGYKTVFGEYAAPKGQYINAAGDTVNSIGVGYSTAGVVQGALWAGLVYGLVQLIGPMVTDDQNKVDAASMALAGGVFAGKAAFSIFGEGGVAGTSLSAGWSLGIGVVVAIGLYLLLYKDTTYEIVTFECQPWDAPTGGDDCEKCNNQGLPCSEYQCRSLGQACQLINQGTDEEKCEWINRHDTDSPSITVWDAALTEDHIYTGTVPIPSGDNNPGRTRIENTDSTGGCVAAFTPLSFGIELDEPGKCKLDIVRKDNFDEMNFFFGGSSLFRYNHTQILSLPGPGALNEEAPTLENDGEYNLYARCQDANGNYNIGEFAISFCVDAGPDTTAPLIVSTNIQNGMPISYNTTSIDIELYVNEPSTCKWDRQDIDYDEMENTMSCSTSVFQMNSRMLYKCSDELNGLKNRQDNDFFFRCKDRAEIPNENRESFEFTLVGTEPLVITSVGPNETIKDSTNSVKVTLEAETSAGFSEGRASCYSSTSGDADSYILFKNTDSHTHSQELYLPEGTYEYFIKCVDLGGNTDEKSVSFEVETDTDAPIVVRAYKEGTNLKLITNEAARCVYGADSRTYPFEDGISLQNVDDVEHFAEWNTNFNYYIKCKDEFDNQPDPNQCTIIVRPFEVYEFDSDDEE